MPIARRTEAAERDLREIAFYIAFEDRRPATTDRIIDELIAKCDSYAENPLIGTASPHLGADYRRFIHKRWAVIYRPIDDGIEVLRIVDAARDYPSLF